MNDAPDEASLTAIMKRIALAAGLAACFGLSAAPAGAEDVILRRDPNNPAKDGQRHRHDHGRDAGRGQDQGGQGLAADPSGRHPLYRL